MEDGLGSYHDKEMASAFLNIISLPLSCLPHVPTPRKTEPLGVPGLSRTGGTCLEGLQLMVSLVLSGEG